MTLCACFVEFMFSWFHVFASHSPIFVLKFCTSAHSYFHVRSLFYDKPPTIHVNALLFDTKQLLWHNDAKGHFLLLHTSCDGSSVIQTLFHSEFYFIFIFPGLGFQYVSCLYVVLYLPQHVNILYLCTKECGLVSHTLFDKDKR